MRFIEIHFYIRRQPSRKNIIYLILSYFPLFPQHKTPGERSISIKLQWSQAGACRAMNRTAQFEYLIKKTYSDRTAPGGRLKIKLKDQIVTLSIQESASQLRADLEDTLSRERERKKGKHSIHLSTPNCKH